MTNHHAPEGGLNPMPQEVLARRKFLAETQSGHDRRLEILLCRDSMSRSGLSFTLRDPAQGEEIASGFNPLPNVTDPRSPAIALFLESLSGVHWDILMSISRNNSARCSNPNHLPAVFHQAARLAGNHYHFPLLERRQMIREILSHETSALNGKIAFSWNLRPSSSWNRTGRVAGLPSPDPDLDHDWFQAVTVSDAYCRKAIRAAMAPYLDSGFEVLSAGPEAACEMCCDRDCRTAFLASLGGRSLLFTASEDMSSHVEGLRNREVAILWAALRVLDVDLASDRMKAAYAVEMNRLRLEFDKSPPDLHELCGKLLPMPSSPERMSRSSIVMPLTLAAS